MDEKGKTLAYKGTIAAKKPQFALWNYQDPIEKQIYITQYKLTVIEPELEQVIIKNISAEFNFFHMLQNATKLAKNHYTTTIENIQYHIVLSKNTIEKIFYTDEFGNQITIEFTNQKTNHTINNTLFDPKIPLDYDIIQG
jgi:outer membrane lipoprotein carrier protein